MSKKCLFILPRFHTNIATGINQLVKEGWNVRVFVENKYDGEDYTYVTPEKISDIALLEKEILNFRPDISLVRYVNELSPAAMNILVNNKFCTYAYCQFPAALMPSPALLERYTSGHPSIRRVSPVLGDRKCKLPANSIYLPLPVVIEQYSPPSRSNERKKIIIVGKLNHERKNQIRAIEFIESLSFQSDFSLTLVGNAAAYNGDPSPEHYDQLVSLSKNKENIQVLENIKHSDMSQLYLDNDFCLLPSFNEPLGTSPLEAMGTGCIPIISNQCGSSYEILSGKQANGIVFDPNNFDSLIDPMNRIISDNYLLNKLALNAYEHALKYLAPKHFPKRLSKLIESW